MQLCENYPLLELAMTDARQQSANIRLMHLQSKQMREEFFAARC
jgi:hypothetical protein